MITDLGNGVLLVAHNPGDEQFAYTIPGYAPIVWNIRIARELCDAGEVVTVLDVEREQLEAIRDRNEWDEARIREVDPSIPGIAAPVVMNRVLFYVLIDGTHRSVRALRDGVTFKARLLTDEASRKCLIAGPAELQPWSYRS